MRLGTKCVQAKTVNEELRWVKHVGGVEGTMFNGENFFRGGEGGLWNFC